MMSGLLTLAAAVVGVTIHVWLARGVLVPLAGGGIEYLFISATVRSAVAIVLVTAGLLTTVHLVVRRLAARPPSLPATSVPGRRDGGRWHGFLALASLDP